LVVLSFAVSPRRLTLVNRRPGSQPFCVPGRAISAIRLLRLGHVPFLARSTLVVTLTAGSASAAPRGTCRLSRDAGVAYGKAAAVAELFRFLHKACAHAGRGRGPSAARQPVPGPKPLPEAGPAGTLRADQLLEQLGKGLGDGGPQAVPAPRRLFGSTMPDADLAQSLSQRGGSWFGGGP